MAWWAWVVAGLALLAAEILTPGGFVLVFFGVAALATGVLAAAGVLPDAWLAWLVFSVGSVGSLLLFRGPLARRLRAGGAPAPAGLVGEDIVLTTDLAPGGIGNGELRGSSWVVRSIEPTTIARGTRCRVVRVDGIGLWVRTEGGGS